MRKEIKVNFEINRGFDSRTERKYAEIYAIYPMCNVNKPERYAYLQEMEKAIIWTSPVTKSFINISEKNFEETIELVQDKIVQIIQEQNKKYKFVR